MFDLFSRILKDTVLLPPPLEYTIPGQRAAHAGAPGHTAGVEYTTPGRPARAPGHPGAAAGVGYTRHGGPEDLLRGARRLHNTPTARLGRRCGGGVYY